MKIYHQDANLLISKLIHVNENDIKKLSQIDRKICMKAIEALALPEDNGVLVNLPPNITFEKAINQIQNTLELKNASKNCFFIQCLISVIKGILNFFHLRVGSGRLFKNMESAKKSYLTQHWMQYLYNYCEVTTNCDLNQAKVIFLGDQHADKVQNTIRQNIIAHYAHEDHLGENIVLLEGLDTDDFPLSLEHKKFVVESWENKQHLEEHDKVIDQQSNIHYKYKLEMNRLEQLKIDKNIVDRKTKLEIIDKIREVRKVFSQQMEAVKIKSVKLKELRDKDLVVKVKDKIVMNNNQKIFVIAGTNHILQNEYSVINFFIDSPYAVMIPKISQLGEKNADQVLEYIINHGSYDAAYQNL